MIKKTIFNTTSQSSFLFGSSKLNPKGSNIKKKAATLMITSLVDAFSILVIYLLFGPSLVGESIDPQLGIQLPVAYKAELANEEIVLVLKNDEYYIKNKKIEKSQLSQEMKTVAKELSNKSDKSLVIIADQKNNIEKINPILIAASEAGLNQLRLAVEQQGD